MEPDKYKTLFCENKCIESILEYGCTVLVIDLSVK